MHFFHTPLWLRMCCNLTVIKAMCGGKIVLINRKEQANKKEEISY